jgi:hypothetical protein
MIESSPESRYETYANLIAPAAVGGALGILFGRGMRRTSSNITALTLLATAAVVAAPVLTDVIRRAANRPSTQRGSRRRLEGIRSGVLPEEGMKDFFIDSPNALLP